MRDELKKITDILSHYFNDDFSQYKTASRLRRVQKRMSLHKITQFEEYSKLLENSQEERENLRKELLIHVSHFFRDPKVFKFLEKELFPKLLKKQEGEDLRIWVAACSTGEEAYSIAMILNELIKRKKSKVKLQIFATDISEDAISIAKKGVYKEEDIKEVPDFFVEKYFTKKNDQYEVDNNLKKSILFTRQNLIQSPPFSKVDFISCRNTLIYFDKPLQNKCFEIFNYSLKDQAYLLLGKSESTLNDSLFSTVNSEHKVYQSKKVKNFSSPLWNYSSPNISSFFEAAGEYNTDMKRLEEEAKQVIFENFIPFSVIVNEKQEVIYFQGNSERFFSLQSGLLTKDLIKLARDEYKSALTSLLEQLIKGDSHELAAQSIFDENGISTYRISGKKLTKKYDSQKAYLISFINRQHLVFKEESFSNIGDKSIEKELFNARSFLENTINKLEDANERLRIKAEQEQVLNEELQSTNEELESSQEELQSLNEELITSNDELQNRLEEVNRLNNLLDNLMKSTQIPTLFLTKELCIRKFTPSIKALISLEESDEGRKIKDFTFKFKAKDLIKDCQKVIQTNKSKSFELLAENGNYYWTQIMPYKTSNQKYDGVVINFYDISVQKTQELELQEHRSNLQMLLKQKSKALMQREQDLSAIAGNFPNGTICLISKSLEVIYANGKAYTGLSMFPEEVRNKDIREVFYPEALEQILAPINRVFKGENVREECVVGDKTFLNSYLPIKNSNGKIERFVLSSIDISDQKKLRTEREQFAYALENSINEIYIFDANTLKFEYVNKGALNNLGYSLAEIIQMTPLDLKKGHTKKTFQPYLNELLKGEKEQVIFETTHTRANGSTYPVEVFLQLAIYDYKKHFVAIINDISERKSQERKLVETKQKMDSAVRITEIGYWEWNFITGEIEWTDRTYEIFGIPKGTPLSYELLASHTHPEDIPKNEADIEKAIAEKKEFNTEFRLVHPDGAIRYVINHLEPLLDEDGEVYKFQGTFLDITDKKQKQIELKTIVDNTEERFVYVDRNLRIVNFNEQFKNDYSTFFNKEVKKGQSILDYATLSEVEALKSLYEKVFKGETIQREFNITAIKNKELTFLMTYKPAYDYKNNIVGAFVSVNDITAIKAAKKAEEEYAKRLSLIAENFPNGSISLLDKDLNFLITDGQGYYEQGANPKDYTGKNVSAVFPKTLANKVIKSAKQALKGDNIEETIYFRDKIYLNTYSPLIRKDEESLLVMTTVDITEKEEARKSLEASEKRLELVLKGSQDAYWDYNIIEDKMYYSESWFEMIGYENNELPNTSGLFYDLMHEDDIDRVKQTIEDAWKDGSDVYEVEARLKHKKGNYVYVLSRAYIERNAKGEPIRSAGTNFDLTEIRLMEQKLKKAKLEAEKANSAKNIFLSNMTHEIKTPLNGIIGFSRLLQSENLTDKSKTFVNHINKSGRSLLDILNSILDFTRLEESESELNIRPVHLNSLVNSVKSSVSFQAAEKGIDLKVVIDEKVPKQIKIDETKVKQLLFNLIGNAIKFTDEGFVMLQINLIEKSTENNFKLRFSVKDSGIGIAKSEQKIIFESFQQSNPSISSHYGGSGLGLAIARNLSKLLKTQIYLNSKLGEGSTFYFDLNVEVDQQEYEIKESSTKRLDKKESRVFEVLIIDDEITNILLAQSLIEVYFPKAKIKTAQNGEAALDQINQQKFDLLLMDLKMPQMNGFELTQIIRKMSNVNKDVPIVAITAGNREENYESCLLAGMNAYINKPIEEEDLIQTISDFLTNKNQHNTNNQIQHFNLNEISRKLKNDEEKVKKLVKAAQPMILSCVEKLNAAIKNNDAKAYYDCLHTVKGSSRNIGFEHLGNLAENAEKIDFLDKKEALNQIESIEKEVEHLKQLINDYIK
ncbi:MAG: hypothetical protein CMC96_12040 [Flavobacteriales bacterium]|nr:hypothetical protein [Flavobacteriales bacterium]|tara:strand:- start:15684 stop:21341 length:5658 start_codon:yes stop_codon:yes gene_type:complete